MFLESKDRIEFFFNDYILDDFYIINFGHERCLPNHSFGPLVREYYVIHYVLKGKGTYSFSDNHYTLKKGDFFLITPYDSDPVYQADEDDPWEYSWFGFNGKKSDAVLQELGYCNDNKAGHFSDPDYMEKQLHNLIYSNFFSNSGALTIQGKLLELLSLLSLDSINISLNSKMSSSEKNIEQFLQYVRQNYWRADLSVQRIADDLGINVSYLSRIISQRFNQSTLKYLTNYRLLKAKFLIENTDYSIGEIAKAIGYENSLSFSRAYKRIYGNSPGNYRHIISEQ